MKIMLLHRTVFYTTWVVNNLFNGKFKFTIFYFKSLSWLS